MKNFNNGNNETNNNKSSYAKGNNNYNKPQRKRIFDPCGFGIVMNNIRYNDVDYKIRANIVTVDKEKQLFKYSLEIGHKNSAALYSVVDEVFDIKQTSKSLNLDICHEVSEMVKSGYFDPWFKKIDYENDASSIGYSVLNQIAVVQQDVEDEENVERPDPCYCDPAPTSNLNNEG